MLEKKVRSLIIILGTVFICFFALSSFSPSNENMKAGGDLESVLCNIDGVDEVSVVFSTNDSEAGADGVAVIYKGSCNEREIYDLINALYDIPYNRIFVSH